MHRHFELIAAGLDGRFSNSKHCCRCTPSFILTLEAIAASIQDYLQRNGRNLEFSVDDSTGQTVITVRDSSTGEVIRQIPNAEALSIAQRLNANSGTLLDAMV